MTMMMQAALPATQQPHRMGMTAMVIALTVGAAVCYGVFLLYAAWIDGKRQDVRDKGLHPTTMAGGEVEAREQRDGRADD